MKQKIILILFVGLFSITSFAQVDSVLGQKEYRNGYISFAAIKQGKSAVVSAKKESFVKELTGNQTGISFFKTVSDIPIKKGKRVQQEK